jgi:hypothetical protein
MAACWHGGVVAWCWRGAVLACWRAACLETHVGLQTWRAHSRVGDFETDCWRAGPAVLTCWLERQVMILGR